MIIFTKSYVNPYVRSDGTTVSGHTTRHAPASGDDEKLSKHKMLAHERATQSVLRKYGTTVGREAEEHYRRLYTGHLENLTGKKA